MTGHIQINTKKGRDINIDFKYSYWKGKIELNTRIIEKNLLFPFGSNLIGIDIKSTFENPINIEIPSKHGKSKNIVEMVTFNRVIRKGMKKNFMQFKIDPSMINYQDEHILSQKNNTDFGICLFDIDKYHNNKVLYKKLKNYMDLKINT